MKKIILSAFMIPSFLFAQTAEEIIKKVDKNQLFVTQKYIVQMTIEKKRRKLVKNFTGYGQKKGEKAFMEFTNPEDTGVKYLKIENELWIYFPDADDIMKISGHMLKQGMMGSDISYEDMLETENIEKKYSSKIIKIEKVNERNCHVIELIARVPDAAYAKQILYIDMENYVPLKIEMYARGGRLLKKMMALNIVKLGWRYVPKKFIIQDMRKRNSKTTMEFKEVRFDIKLPAGVFKRRYLKR